jgi:hypothetical protein
VGKEVTLCRIVGREVVVSDVQHRGGEGRGALHQGLSCEALNPRGPREASHPSTALRACDRSTSKILWACTMDATAVECYSSINFLNCPDSCEAVTNKHIDIGAESISICDANLSQIRNKRRIHTQMHTLIIKPTTCSSGHEQMNIWGSLARLHIDKSSTPSFPPTSCPQLFAAA